MKNKNQNKNKKHPKYLYLDTLVIPAGMQRLIQHLAPKEQRIYSFFVSSIITHAAEFGEDKPGYFVNVHSMVFYNYATQHKGEFRYTHYLDRLNEWGVVEINPKYKPNNFTKSYRIGKSFQTDHIKVQFRNRSFAKRKNDFAALEQYRSDPVLSYVHESIGQLTTIDGDEYTMRVLNLSPEREARATNSLKKIYSGVTELKYGEKCGRLFHSVICSVRESREFLVWKDGSKVVDNDFSTLHPRLLFQFFYDSRERLNYREFLRGDIYESILDYLHNSQIDLKIFDRKINRYTTVSFDLITRTHVKREFMKFINSGKKNGVYKFFSEHFPKTVSNLHFDQMAASLQRIESVTMVQKLIQFCIDNGIKRLIPMHDGWLSDGKHDKLIEAFLVSEFDFYINSDHPIRVEFPVSAKFFFLKQFEVDSKSNESIICTGTQNNYLNQRVTLI